MVNDCPPTHLYLRIPARDLQSLEEIRKLSQLNLNQIAEILFTALLARLRSGTPIPDVLGRLFYTNNKPKPAPTLNKEGNDP